MPDTIAPAIRILYETMKQKLIQFPSLFVKSEIQAFDIKEEDGIICWVISTRYVPGVCYYTNNKNRTTIKL